MSSGQVHFGEVAKKNKLKEKKLWEANRRWGPASMGCERGEDLLGSGDRSLSLLQLEKEVLDRLDPLRVAPGPRPLCGSEGIGMGADGAGYLKMPSGLGKQYFHKQLLKDSGAAYAGHEMVVHHEDGDICNNCEKSWIFMTRAEYARAHGFGGAR